MIVDSSALIAVLFNEPESRTFTRMLMTSRPVRISAVTAVETAIVTIRKVGLGAEPDIASLFEILGIEVVDFSADYVRLAQEAFRTYGKGRHCAALNFGDCFSYALSKATGEPLLYKGNDFSQTDIVSALV